MLKVMYTRSMLMVALGVAALIWIPNAAAAVPLPAPLSAPEIAPMTIAGYDSNVASANGFAIVTDEDGNQKSIPVTSEAQAIASRAAGTISISRLSGSSTVRGSCGSSSIAADRRGAKSVLVRTSYSVRLPVSARMWSVTLIGMAGARIWELNGNAGGQSWGMANTLAFASGGVAGVTPLSSVVLIDGTICVTGSPTTSF